MKSLPAICFYGILMIAGCHSIPEKDTGTLNNYRQALDLVRAASKKLDANTLANQAGGIYLEGSGTYDLSTRMQGKRPDAEEPYPITEMLGVDPQSGRVAYESDTYVNPDAREWIRYIYDGKNRMLFLERYAGFAFWESRPGLNEQAKRYSNMVPHLLLEEALANRESLKYLGEHRNGNHLVSFNSPVYGSMTIHISNDSATISGVDYLEDMPLLGDTPVRWRFKEYRHYRDIGPYPAGYTVYLKERMLKEINYETVRAGSNGLPVFEIPDSISVPPTPDPPDTVDPGTNAPGAPVREPLALAKGVHVIPHIRPGFHPMVIEFNEYLMVVDTPAGWLEMQQLPAMQWVGDASSSSTGRKLLQVIRENISEKPVRYAALTHFHSDHAGGIRPFIDAGATVLASPATASVINSAATSPFTLEPDELTGKNTKPVIEIVKNKMTISDGSMEVQLIDVGENPHAEGMLVVYLPNQKILYQSDLFEPTNLTVFPNKSRLPVMKWFVGWLDDSGLDVDKIYAIHAGLRVTEEHLRIIREINGPTH